MVQTMTTSWLQESTATQAAGAPVAGMREQSERTAADTALLRQLAEQCRLITVPLDTAPAHELVAELALGR